MSAMVEYRLPRSPALKVTESQNTSGKLFCTHLLLRSARQLYLYKTLPARLQHDNFFSLFLPSPTRTPNKKNNNFAGTCTQNWSATNPSRLSQSMGRTLIWNLKWNFRLPSIYVSCKEEGKRFKGGLIENRDVTNNFIEGNEFQPLNSY